MLARSTGFWSPSLTRLPGHGFLFTGSNYYSIDVPGSREYTEALGINDAGQIVGLYEDSLGKGHGFLLRIPDRCGPDRRNLPLPLMFRALSTPLPLEINNNGQIVGDYGYQDTHGFFAQGDCS